MKKIVCILGGVSIIFLNASGDFKDKHLKCTLVEKESEIISERQAESLEEFKVDIFLSKLKIEKDLKTFKFEKIENGDEIYSRKIYDSISGSLYDKAIYHEYNKQLHIFEERIDFEYEYEYDDKNAVVTQEDMANELSNWSNKKKFEPIKKTKISDGNKYDCLEATFFEKIKYKYDNY